MSEVHEGDQIKVIGNHCYKGREGVVEQTEDADGELYVHAILNDSGEKIIMREGQCKVVRQGSPENHRKTLLDEIRPHLERVRNNKRYSYGTRIDVLSAIGELCDTMLLELCGERDREDRKEEQSELHG